MKDSKNWVIGGLCAVLCIMAVAYAAFSTTLNINGTATIESNWCVRIQDSPVCETTVASGGAEGSVTATASKTNNTDATVTMKFTQPGDSATCTVIFENCGDLDAKLSTHSITGASEEGPIKVTVTGLTDGTKLPKSTGTNSVVIKGEFDEEQTGTPDASSKSKTIKITADYVQDLTAAD